MSRPPPLRPADAGPSDPLVGVVVPAYNAQRWVAATLESLLAQTFTGWTCVVVDDGSTDDTAAVVHRYAEADARISLVRQTNAGLPATRNVALAALPPGCRYVGFLDSDDLYAPDALALLVRALDARPDAVGAYGLAAYVDEQGVPFAPGVHAERQRDRREISGRRLRALPPHADATFRDIVVRGPIWPPAVALHRLDIVRDIDGFDVTFGSQEDWDFYLRASRHGPFVALDCELASYRRHSSNMTGQHYDSAFHQDRVRAKAYRSADNTPEQARQVARAWRYLEVRQIGVLGWHALRSLVRGRWRDAGTWAVGALLCLLASLHAGPPSAGRGRLRYTRPETLPGAQIFDD